MYREIMNDLIYWKDKSNRKPLLLSGVRQCGKTYIVKEFGKSCFDNMVYLNFESSENIKGIFEYDFDVERIVTEIKYLAKEKIILGKTLLFFDEIQTCPRAITALKYFAENKKELHIVCAGSLLGVALRRENISFPVGKINRLKMYPMNFKEFILACGREDLIKVLNNWPTDRAIPELYSVPLKKLLKEYYIVGGMPEVVKTWVDSGNFVDTEEVIKEILNDYADDFAKYAPLSEVMKIRQIWDSIPVQLAKENNKFVFSHVKAGKRASELEDALRWLVDSGLVAQVFMVEKPELPLDSFADKTYFKVYMSDIGLLRVRSGLSAETIINETDIYSRFKGAFSENYVFNELISLNKNLYFWRSGNQAEVDFIFEDKGSIIPIEVKSADNTKAKSYTNFCKRYEPELGFKLTMKNIGESLCDKTRTINLPLYMSFNIDNYYIDNNKD